MTDNDFDRPVDSYRVPGVVCLECGHKIDGAAPTSSRAIRGEHAPDAGNASLCVYCGALGVFERHALGYLFLRPPTVAERAELLRQHEVVEAMAAVRVLHEGESTTLSFEPDVEDTSPEDVARIIAGSDVVLCLGQSTDLMTDSEGRTASAVTSRMFNPGGIRPAMIAAALRTVADAIERPE